MTPNFSFEKLHAYQVARLLVKSVYHITEDFPSFEKFGLSSQLQRAVVSIASNIAEGSGRKSIKEKIHFLEIAYGSLLEVYCQLQLAMDLCYICEAKFLELKTTIFELSRLIGGLNASFVSSKELG
ncbi:MAG: four helix bundle protein [Muribaculaceae bacterium]